MGSLRSRVAGREWRRRWRRIEHALLDLLTRFRRPGPLGRARRVVFVCKGNICRSAFAERQFRALAPGIETLSAGVEVGTPSPPPEAAIAAGARLGVALDGHRSRSLTTVDDSPDTLYFALEPWQARAALLARARGERRVHLLGLWGTPPRAHFPDPFGKDDESYDHCFAALRSALVALGACLADRQERSTRK